MVPATIKHYISISDLSEDILAPTLPANARIRRVRNFIDTLPWSKPVPVDRNDTFVYAGRLSSEKGALLFARAAEQTRVKTVFVGDGPLRHQVERLAPNAEFTGWLNPSDTLSRLRDARALVFPSLWYETQGLVVGEAASMGVPAIVPDTCAAREWVEDGVTGLWFRGGDQTSLIKQLRLLNDQPELAAALGKEAHRRYWEQPATRARHCEELMSLYQQILAAQLNEPIPVCETS
jgi:glycosyltransferase involved in cell wall biosynthesis